MMSGTVSRSPRTIADAVTPITGTSNEPSDAVTAGKRSTIDHHRKCASPTPNSPTKSTARIVSFVIDQRCGWPSNRNEPAVMNTSPNSSCQAALASGSTVTLAHLM